MLYRKTVAPRSEKNKNRINKYTVREEKRFFLFVTGGTCRHQCAILDGVLQLVSVNGKALFIKR